MLLLLRLRRWRRREARCCWHGIFLCATLPHWGSEGVWVCISPSDERCAFAALSEAEKSLADFAQTRTCNRVRLRNKRAVTEVSIACCVKKWNNCQNCGVKVISWGRHGWVNPITTWERLASSYEALFSVRTRCLDPSVSSMFSPPPPFDFLKGNTCSVLRFRWRNSDLDWTNHVHVIDKKKDVFWFCDRCVCSTTRVPFPSRIALHSIWLMMTSYESCLDSFNPHPLLNRTLP